MSTRKTALPQVLDGTKQRKSAATDYCLPTPAAMVRFLMGLFAYVYYSSIIRDNHVTVGSVMQTVISSLNTQEQVELAKALHGYLAQQGIKWR